MHLLIRKESRLLSRKLDIEELTGKHGGVIETAHDLTIVRYNMEVRGGLMPALKIWKGTSAHPMLNYYYRRLENREAAVTQAIESAAKRLVFHEERRKVKREYAPNVKVGDIFVSSWGYDQTNVDFYQVLSIDGRKVVTQEIKSQSVPGSDGFMSCRVVACPGQFRENSKPENHVLQLGDKLTLSDTRRAWKWDGREQYCSWYA